MPGSADSRDPSPPAPDLHSHGSHLLSPILEGEAGTRSAHCPVCRAQVELTDAGGWLNVCCGSCGTYFVATDGKTPPPPAPEPPRPARSPIAPSEPLDPLEPGDRPRGFTSDVRTTPDGRRRVTCPRCLRAELEVPADAEVAVVLRCPLCHGPFLVGLGAVSIPPSMPDPLPPAPPPPPKPKWSDLVLLSPDGRWWVRCPTCSRELLIPPGREPVTVLECPSCKREVVADLTPWRTPGPPPTPRPRRSWARVVWDWFKATFTG